MIYEEDGGGEARGKRRGRSREEERAMESARVSRSLCGVVIGPCSKTLTKLYFDVDYDHSIPN